MPADLHIHTTHSDGSDSPQKVVERAVALGLDAIAITDHDTVSGVPSAVEAAKDLSLVVVPGVEINTDYTGQEIHILGYFLDINDPNLIHSLGLLAKARDERVHSIVKKLRTLGVRIELDAVQLKKAGTLGRPHVAEALCSAGVVSTIQEAFDRYIGRGKPAFVPRSCFTPLDAVTLVQAAGGIPVMAHPGPAGADRLIPKLVESGLMGLEVFHPEHSQDDIDHYLELCQRYGLIATGGSDYHGHRYRSQLGQSTVSKSVVDQMRQLSL